MNGYFQGDLFGGKIVEKESIFLFFDTETTGLPKKWNAPITELDNWPRIVSLAWKIYGSDGREFEGVERIVRPEGFLIPEESSKIHGITNEIAEEKGLPLDYVLKEFSDVAKRAEKLIAHNISYDEKVVSAEYLRKRIDNPLKDKVFICTKEMATDFCAIEGPYGFKWPKLVELHKKLFGEEFLDAHNAMADVTATARCYWEMKKRGIL